MHICVCVEVCALRSVRTLKTHRPIVRPRNSVESCVAFLINCDILDSHFNGALGFRIFLRPDMPLQTKAASLLRNRFKIHSHTQERFRKPELIQAGHAYQKIKTIHEQSFRCVWCRDWPVWFYIRTNVVQIIHQESHATLPPLKISVTPSLRQWAFSWCHLSHWTDHQNQICMLVRLCLQKGKHWQMLLFQHE